jgi:TonB family protein
MRALVPATLSMLSVLSAWSMVVCPCPIGDLVGIGGGGAVVAAQPLTGAPVRVGGNIRPPSKIHDVRAEYPPEAQQARVSGIVILEATVDPDGSVSNARVLRGVPMLNDAAVNAVREWRYEPTLLNGVAVPVIMTVTVNFTLSGGNDGGSGPAMGFPPRSRGLALPDDPAADAAGAAQPFLLVPGRAGIVRVGMRAKDLLARIPAAQISQRPGEDPGVTFLEIATEPGGEAALVATTLGTPDAIVMQVEVRSERFRTADGLGVNSTLGDLRAKDQHLLLAPGPNGPWAVLSDSSLTFVLDGPGGVPTSDRNVRDLPLDTRVTHVLLASPPLVMPRR